jgi:hypothetical protein
VDVAAACLEGRLDGVEAPGKLVVCGRQGSLGLYAELAGQVGDREQQVSHFFGRPRVVLGQSRAQFPDLLLHLRHDIGR